MNPKLRTDGTWTMYRVEFFCAERNCADADCWHDFSDTIVAKVPARLRFTAKGLRTHSGESKQPFHDFSAGGECWQTTGLHGTFSKPRAMKYAELLSEYNPGTKFRVVRHVVMQRRTEIMQVCH